MAHVVCSKQRVRSHRSQPALQYQSSCSWCELVWVVLKLVEQAIVEMEVRKRDLQSCLAVANRILERARQQSEMGSVVKQLQVLRDFFLLPNLPEELVSAVSRAALFFGIETKVGKKRGLRDPRKFHQYVDDCCAISIHYKTSKKAKFVGPDPDSSRYVASTFNCYKNDCQYISSDVIEEFSSLDSLDSTPLGNTSCKRVASGILGSLVRNICNVQSCLPIVGNRKVVGVSHTRNSKIAEVTERAVEVQERVIEVPEKVETPTNLWESLPNDLRENILHRLEFKDLFRFKTFFKSCKECIESEAYHQCRDKARSSQCEGQFTAINYHIKNKQWRWSGYDLSTRMWKRLPSLSQSLPNPDRDLFKEYSLCGHGGLVCADIAKLPKKGELVVLNPLTQKKRELPPLLYPRSPVLIHLWVDSASASKFKVIVAGSSVSSDEKLSRKIEVFDSETSVWEAAPDLPGPAFGLNEHQVGVCVDGVLHFISFLDSGDGTGRGVVAFDLKTRTWLGNRACPIPFATYSNTLQLVESKGKVCLFSEQERAGLVTHCIDVLELVDEKWKLRTVVRVKKSGGRGLQVYPEHTCVSFGDEKLCIFNTLTRSGVVYDMKDGKEVEALEPPPFDQKGDNFFSLNPASFVLQPSFGSDPGSSS